MLLLTEDAKLVCKHELGKVDIAHSQDLVRIDGRYLLVAFDPEGCRIIGCPEYAATIKPCTYTLPVKDGYSDLLRITGRPVCLDTVIGLTDGTPPGTVNYLSREAGQEWVCEAK